MKLNKNKTSALVVTHFAIRTNQGPAAPSIFQYLLKRTKRVFYIEMPFPYAKVQTLFLSVYENEALIYQKRVNNLKGPAWAQYLHHFFVCIFFVILSKSRFDICVACENLSFISIFLFRKIGVIKRIVYYTIDYTDERFPNAFMNFLYHKLDQLSCKISDINWVVTKQQIEARKKRLNFKTSSSFRIVPIGYDLEEFNKTPAKKISSYQLAYAGAFLEQAGVQLAIKALPFLKTRYPKIKLLIMGSGSYEQKLKDLISRLKISRYVKFLGHVEDFFDLVSFLKGSTIGLAPFLPIHGSVSFNADSSKIKLYLACGLPVITTEVTTISPILRKYKAGVSINADEKSLAKAVDYLFKNKQNYKEYRRKTILLSKKYDINNILDKAFNSLN